jgi:hypothetical protein
MITIYPPRIDLVTLNTLREPATMCLHSRSGMSIDNYKDLIVDIQSAINLIESVPTDYSSYIANQERIDKSIDDFNSHMYFKWRLK